MKLQPSACYRAVASRDRRFEGRFVVAVTTTNVYCRPGCPAPIPKRENVRFYVCAAAAESEGFRPCMRCRPETSPGSPAWMGSSATVSRALRLIDEGALDDAGMNDLADRLGVGPRHLRRLFVTHVGVSPLAIATTRRLHFARKLIDETVIPMAEVAFSSGFSSVRRFNDAMRETFRRTPRELRRLTGAKAARAEPSGVDLRIPVILPYDAESMFAFLRARAIPGVEVVGTRRYRRTILVGGAPGVVDVTFAESARALTLRVEHPDARYLMPIVERVGRIFDARADAMQIAADLGRDRRLAPFVARRPGLRVPGAWDAFELAVRAILGQQVSVRAATTLSGRLVAQFGTPFHGSREAGLTHLFPAPAVLAAAEIERIGLPSARASAIRAVATAVRDGALTMTSSLGLEDAVARLCEVPGVGPWTAAYIAMRACGEPDAFPHGDLALRRAYSAGGRAVTSAELLERAEAWRPWRAYAAMHLWSELASQSNLENSTK